MLKVKSSAKTHRRYLLIHGTKDEVEKTILDYIGILGWAKAAPVFLKSESSKVILAVERSELDNVRAAFAISSSDSRVLKVSGTLKGLN